MNTLTGCFPSERMLSLASQCGTFCSESTVVLRDKVHRLIQSIKNTARWPFLDSGVVRFGLGYALGSGLWFGLRQVASALKGRISNPLGLNSVYTDRALSWHSLIALSPWICVLAPIVEEVCFRAQLPDWLKEQFEPFYLNCGFEPGTAQTAALVTALFFSSLLFGLIHFNGHYSLLCLPKIITAAIGGLILNLVKEYSGSLELPIAMHIGNNTTAWLSYMFTKM